MTSERPSPDRSRLQGKRVARSYTPSQKAQVLEYEAMHGVSAAAEKFGVSRFSIYDWKRRLETPGTARRKWSECRTSSATRQSDRRNRKPTPFEWTMPARASIRSRDRMLDRISRAVH